MAFGSGGKKRDGACCHFVARFRENVTILSVKTASARSAFLFEECQGMTSRPLRLLASNLLAHARILIRPLVAFVAAANREFSAGT